MNKNKIDAISHGVLLLAWVIGLIMIAVSADAQTMRAKVRVQIAEGTRGYTCNEAKQVYKTVEETFKRELGVRFQSKIRCQPQPFTHTLIDQISGRMVLDWHNLFKKRVQPMIVIQPLVQDFGRWWTGGVAIITYRIGVAFVGAVNSLGEDRSTHAYVTIAHELGHAFGASHDSSGPNIMHSNAISQALEGLTFTRKSKREIRQTIRKDRKNGTWQRRKIKLKACYLTAL